jgi:hypothetical protein
MTETISQGSASVGAGFLAQDFDKERRAAVIGFFAELVLAAISSRRLNGMPEYSQIGNNVQMNGKSLILVAARNS